MVAMRTAWLILALALLDGCSPASISANKPGPESPAPGTGENANPPLGAVAVTGGCGITQLYTGALPHWAKEVASDGVTGSAAPPGPYAIATPPMAVAILSTLPLLSVPLTKTKGRGNEIFWAVMGVRLGEVVAIEAFLPGSSSPAARYDMGPPASVSGRGAFLEGSPGVPTAGCWHFILRWAGHQVEMDLKYE